MRNFTYERRQSVADMMGDSGAKESEMFSIPIHFYRVSRPGDHWIRILPPGWENPATYGVEFMSHFLGRRRVWAGRMFGVEKDADPVVQIQNDLYNQGRRDEAKRLYPRSTFAVWIIDRENPQLGPQLAELPMTKVAAALDALALDKRTNTFAPIDSPEHGQDVIFSVEGSGLNIQYQGIKIDSEKTPLADTPEQSKQWLDYIVANNIPAIIKKPTDEQFARYADEFRALINGADAQQHQQAQPAHTAAYTPPPTAAYTPPPTAHHAPPPTAHHASPPPTATANGALNGANTGAAQGDNRRRPV